MTVNYKAFKNRIFEIISKADDGDRISKIVDWSIMGLIALCVLAIILESFANLYFNFYHEFRAFEVFTVVVFTIEYLLRIWTADLLYPDSKHPRLKYMLSFMAIIDLLAILPFYLPFFAADLRFLRMMRLFRLFRLLRVLKLGRYFDALQIIMKVIKDALPQLIMAFVICFFVVLFSSIIMYTVENPVQTEAFPNVIASLWWAICTLTTVGYGDVYPITTTGKILASLISIVGIGIIAIPTGIIAAEFDKFIRQKQYDEIEHLQMIEALPVNDMDEETLIALELKVSGKLKDYGYQTTISIGEKKE